jgi:hypothetical protein
VIFSGSMLARSRRWPRRAARHPSWSPGNILAERIDERAPSVGE